MQTNSALPHLFPLLTLKAPHPRKTGTVGHFIPSLGGTQDPAAKRSTLGPVGPREIRPYELGCRGIWEQSGVQSFLSVPQAVEQTSQ